MVPERHRGRVPAALAVLFLTLAALLLRLVGLDCMLPYQLEPDHGLVRTVAWLDRPSDLQEESPWAGPTPIYPWLMPRIVQAMPGSAYPTILAVEAPLEDHLASASRPFHRVRLLAAQPDAEIVLEGEDATALGDEFLAIPTPGHTRGHAVLLVRDRYLFTGDHLWWSRGKQRLWASRSVCWHDWGEQTRSMEKLLAHRFEWILPGHGERLRRPAEEMQRELASLVGTMRGIH